MAVQVVRGPLDFLEGIEPGKQPGGPLTGPKKGVWIPTSGKPNLPGDTRVNVKSKVGIEYKNHTVDYINWAQVAEYMLI